MEEYKAIKYLKVAKKIAKIFSKDPSTKVAAILLNSDYNMISYGYNCMPCGLDDNIDSRWIRPIKYKYVEHAERNAIYNATRKGIKTEGSIAITTLFPCTDCTRALIQSGIRTIVCPSNNEINNSNWNEDWKISLEILNECGINILYIDSCKL